MAASCRAASRPSETIQLPPRDTRASEKKQAKQEEDVRLGRSLRLARGHDQTTSPSSGREGDPP